MRTCGRRSIRCCHRFADVRCALLLRIVVDIFAVHQVAMNALICFASPSSRSTLTERGSSPRTTSGGSSPHA
jgi:hypothetical protein